MKKNLKKLFALGCTAALTLTTAGCSSSTSSNASEADTTAETSQEASADKKIYNVAIVQISSTTLPSMRLQMQSRQS